MMITRRKKKKTLKPSTCFA